MYYIGIFVFIIQTCITVNLFKLSQDTLESLLDSRKNEDQRKQHKDCNYLLSILKDWTCMVRNNPLFFEDPFLNYKALKTMVIDIPGACQIEHKALRQPKKIDVQNSILMILEIVSFYKMDIEEAFAFIPNITASDCFVFCILALDIEQELVNNEETLVLVKSFLEKGKSLMNSTKEFNSERNHNLMKRGNLSIMSKEQETEFRKLCSNSKMNSQIKNDAQCKTLLTYSWRKIKLEIVNKNPIVEVYHDFLSDQEILLLSNEVSKFPFQTAQTSNDDVDFRVEVMIDGIESQLVRDLHFLIDDVTGLSTDEEDYLQVVKYRPGGVFPPHLDYFEDAQKEEDYNLGNRVAQAMIFLSDVKLGGGFAMPALGIYVPPKAGTMIVWHNVDINGENSKLSLHGGCPVWSVNKVAAITSFHALNQKQWSCQ